MPDIDWKARIVELVLVKQRLHEVDREGLWEHRLPAVAATPAELQAAETALGEPLDALHRGFLTAAGGWLAFWHDVDLFGPGDLVGGPRWSRGAQAVADLEEDVVRSAGVTREVLLPIAVSAADLDLFVLTRRAAARPGMVLWFAGAEVDRFADFHEFFVAMTDYNRLEVQALEQDARGTPGGG
jgi:hypothetical protein